MYNEDFGFEDCSALRIGKYGLEEMFKNEKGSSSTFVPKISYMLNHTPDRFTPSRARCAENSGSPLTHRLITKKKVFFLCKMM